METPRKHLRFALPLVALAAFGCGAYVVTPATMPVIALPAGAAHVCIVRRGTAGVATFPVRDNSILVGATVAGSCFCYFAAEGHHEIEARSDGYDHIDIDVKSGAEVVILQTAQTAVGITRSILERAESQDGKAALSSCQYAVLTEIPEGSYKAKPEAVVVAK